MCNVFKQAMTDDIAYGMSSKILRKTVYNGLCQEKQGNEKNKDALCSVSE